MECIILSSVQDVSPYLKRIAVIADQHRDEFGFLPFTAYEELALREQLWVATTPERDQILGYLAFGGSHSAAKVFQLYVNPEARRKGIGSALLGKLKEHARARHYQVIKARVATDLPANQFWEGQGFYIIQQVSGGRTTKRIINVRVHDIPMSCLWSGTAESDVTDWLHTPAEMPLLPAPTYALDLNILFDVIRDRPDAELARRIFSAALNGDFRLCVSQELAAELKRHSDGPDGDPVLKFAQELPTLPAVTTSQLGRLTETLRPIVFPDREPSRREAENDLSDLRHLAACIHHGIRGFVTRERAILRAAPVLSARMGLRVLSPLDLTYPADIVEPLDVSTELHAGPTTVRAHAYDHSHAELVRKLIREINIPEALLDTVLDAGTSTRPRSRSVVLANGVLVAVASWSDVNPGASRLRAHIFVDETAAGAQLAIDHLLGTFLSNVPEQRLVTCELHTARSQVATRSTARLLGFAGRLDTSGALVGLSKQAYRGLIGTHQWAQFTSQFRAATGTRLPESCPPFAEAATMGLMLGKPSVNEKRTIDLMTFEAELSPLLILAPGRKTILVPIRDKLAADLLPAVAIQHPLFRKEAVAHIERAYFGKAANCALFERGALVVFYISQADGGRGQAVGIGRITSSGSGTPTRLSLDLLRQGVLNVDDLGQLAASAEEIGYFTFDSFTKFPRPVSFAELKAAGCISAANLVTSQKLEFDKLQALIKLSHGTGEI
jgi:GNAT superfamily N-acetyltransferase/predicted nucleic acid-binding protein